MDRPTWGPPSPLPVLEKQLFELSRRKHRVILRQLEAGGFYLKVITGAHSTKTANTGVVEHVLHTQRGGVRVFASIDRAIPLLKKNQFWNFDVALIEPTPEFNPSAIFDPESEDIPF